MGNERGDLATSAMVANPGASWTALGTGDFNGNGLSDILLQNKNGQVAIWEMNGTHLVTSAVVASPAPSWVAVGTGDFNGDGLSDILLQNTDGRVAIWEMNGTHLVTGAVWPILGRTGKRSEPATSMTTAIPTSCCRTRAAAKSPSGK